MGIGGFLQGDEKVLKLERRWLHNIVNTPNDTELYSSKWLCVLWILPQFFKAFIKPLSIKPSIQQNENIKIIKV